MSNSRSTSPSPNSETVTVTQKLVRVSICTYKSDYYTCLRVEDSVVLNTSTYTLHPYNLISWEDSLPLESFVTHNIQRTPEGESVAQIWGITPFELAECTAGPTYVDYYTVDKRRPLPKYSRID